MEPFVGNERENGDSQFVLQFRVPCSRDRRREGTIAPGGSTMPRLLAPHSAAGQPQPASTFAIFVLIDTGHRILNIF